MKTILQTLAAFFLTTMTAPAAVEFNDATLKLLKSTNPSERARFYTVVGELPPEENEKCVRQLREAWDFHKAALVQAAAGLGGPQGSWGLFTKGRAEWRAAADLLTKAIATDWHKDAAKVAELTRELTRCARLHDRMRSAARTAEKTDLARLLAGCAVLVEIDQQTAYALTQGGTFKADPMATLLRAVGDSPEVAAKINELTDFLAADKAFAEAEPAEPCPGGSRRRRRSRRRGRNAGRGELVRAVAAGMGPSQGSSQPAKSVPSPRRATRSRVRESPWQKENAKGTNVPATRVLNRTAGLSNHGYL